MLSVLVEHFLSNFLYFILQLLASHLLFLFVALQFGLGSDFFEFALADEVLLHVADGILAYSSAELILVFFKGSFQTMNPQDGGILLSLSVSFGSSAV